VLSRRLHSDRWNSPHRCRKIEFPPFCLPQLARANEDMGGKTKRKVGGRLSTKAVYRA
jgi:hypothetical protein